MLRQLRLPLRHYEARQYLEQVQSVIDFLTVYAHYFPTDYAESMQRVAQGQDSLFPEDGEAYSPHEVQLLKLIDRHLFELPLWYVLEDACADNRCHTIPIEPFGIELEGDDFLDLDLGWQLMFYLLGAVEPELFAALLEDERAAIFAVPIEQGGANGEALRQACHGVSEPLAFLYQVMGILWHDTGTVWLDATAEMPCDTADWSIETIDELVRQCDEAHDIKAQAEQCLDWMEGDLVPRFTEVIQLWNKAVLLTKQGQNAAVIR